MGEKCTKNYSAACPSKKTNFACQYGTEIVIQNKDLCQTEDVKSEDIGKTHPPFNGPHGNKKAQPHSFCRFAESITFFSGGNRPGDKVANQEKESS